MSGRDSVTPFTSMSTRGQFSMRVTIENPSAAISTVSLTRAGPIDDQASKTGIPACRRYSLRGVMGSFVQFVPQSRSPDRKVYFGVPELVIK